MADASPDAAPLDEPLDEPRIPRARRWGRYTARALGAVFAACVVVLVAWSFKPTLLDFGRPEGFRSFDVTGVVSVRAGDSYGVYAVAHSKVGPSNATVVNDADSGWWLSVPGGTYFEGGGECLAQLRLDGRPYLLFTTPTDPVGTRLTVQGHDFTVRSIVDPNRTNPPSLGC